MSPMKFLSDEEAAYVLQTLRDGRTVREICCGKRGPKLATYATFRRHCASHPDMQRKQAP
jgi:hypothetical protein